MPNSKDDSQGLRDLVVTAVDAMRLDRYLRIIDESLTQGAIEKALRSGDIKIAGKKVKSNHRVQNGDVLTINRYFKISDQKKKAELSFDPGVISLAQKITSEYLLYEDENLIAINKPTKLPTQGGNKINISVDHALEYLNSKGYDLRLVHRLDRETSGILLLAKTRSAATRLAKAFENRRIMKKYLAVTHGKLKLKEEGRVESFLGKIEDKICEMSKNSPDAKLAVTDYKILDSNAEGFYLVEFTPMTGRMHQLRAHAAYSMGTPIVGDEKYGSNILDRRLLLHASEIEISEEIFGKKIKVKANVDKCFYL
ncbi:MAG: RluA family pseudouridine synthase [Rickettsiaceae bacterium]|nr:RluA family pseudouridine synthase [Rickettsiaceae bacterium]